MKYTLTILFACLLVGAKAQTPLDTDKEEPECESEKSVVLSYCVGVGNFKCPNVIVDISYCAVKVEKEPTPPVDMMVRHYFAMSYWD